MHACPRWYPFDHLCETIKGGSDRPTSPRINGRHLSTRKRIAEWQTKRGGGGSGKGEDFVARTRGDSSDVTREGTESSVAFFRAMTDARNEFMQMKSRLLLLASNGEEKGSWDAVEPYYGFTERSRTPLHYRAS